MGGVEFLQLLEGSVCVVYSGRDRVVPEELLEKHQVSSRVEHIGGEGVA